MIRLLAPALALVLALAGCITVPEDPGATPAAAVEREERIDGMTASVTQTDAPVDCGGGGLQLPPRFCYERILVAEGQIGVEHLPVELIGSNGEINILPSEGDAWRFTATIRVAALTEEMARDALDTAWTWAHEKDDGRHALVARPTPTNAPLLEPRAIGLTYTLELPTWITIDLDAETDNGRIYVDGFTMDKVDLETDNGEIGLIGKARELKAATDNGQITAYLRPLADGAFDLKTDNGQIVLSVPEGRTYGYDIEATTDNGQVVIGLDDGDRSGKDDGATFRTKRFDERAIKTRISAEADNGQIVIRPM